MQTGDGLLVRLNPVAGGLSPDALIGLCEAASRARQRHRRGHRARQPADPRPDGAVRASSSPPRSTRSASPCAPACRSQTGAARRPRPRRDRRPDAACRAHPRRASLPPGSTASSARKSRSSSTAAAAPASMRLSADVRLTAPSGGRLKRIGRSPLAGDAPHGDAARRGRERAAERAAIRPRLLPDSLSRPIGSLPAACAHVPASVLPRHLARAAIRARSCRSPPLWGRCPAGREGA